MTCPDCDKAQEHTTLIYPVRVGAANVELRGCTQHVGALITLYRLGMRFRDELLPLMKGAETVLNDLLQPVEPIGVRAGDGEEPV